MPKSSCAWRSIADVRRKHLTASTPLAVAAEDRPRRFIAAARAIPYGSRKFGRLNTEMFYGQ